MSLPLRLVGSQDPAVIGQESINLTLYVCRLCPNSATAGKLLGLLSNFFKQQARTVVVCIEIEVDFVCLVDGIEGLLNVPKTSHTVRREDLDSEEAAEYLLVIGHNMSDTTKFALEADALGIILGGQDRVERCTALRVCVVVVVKEITVAMIVPSGNRVDKSRLIQVTDNLGKYLLRIWWAAQLSPSLIVNDPLNNRSVALVLVDEGFELTLKLLLLCTVRLGWRRQAWHVLDNHQTNFIAGLVKQSRLDLDLLFVCPVSTFALLPEVAGN